MLFVDSDIDEDIDIYSWVMVNGMVIRSGPEGKKHVILTTKIFGTEVYGWTLGLGTKSKHFTYIDGYQESLREQEAFC